MRERRASESTDTSEITVTIWTIQRWRGSAALPGLLLALTAITGLVDAVSYLKLGNVFVANMTGNVVFLGFGLTQKTSISATASLLAIATFLLGASAVDGLPTTTAAIADATRRSRPRSGWPDSLSRC
jgi:hypothetical protein